MLKNEFGFALRCQELSGYAAYNTAVLPVIPLRKRAENLSFVELQYSICFSRADVL